MQGAFRSSVSRLKVVGVARCFNSSVTRFKVPAPAMVYGSGEEMTRYACELMLDKWIRPYVDTSAWEFYDLSCHNRDRTDDAVLREAVQAGKRIGAIFKEPTMTPSADQVKSLGLKKALPSPNGLMRKGWNGITISRDTIHIAGMDLGFKRPVVFDRQAVGGEYQAGFRFVGPGKVSATFQPASGGPPLLIDERSLTEKSSAVVVYSNPHDSIEDMAHIFFQRCLAESCRPIVTTKKTVFKWQEPFWEVCKRVFDQNYAQRFKEVGLGDLQHIISDAATMQIIKWRDGGFGMISHNYDGDVLTDLISQVHGSPGFITSNLIGKREDGVLIKEFEASHGTVADMWQAHLQGKETSLNPLGLSEALIGAMRHAATLDTTYQAEIVEFTRILRSAIHRSFATGQGTRDLAGPKGLTTEQFIENVASWLKERVPVFVPKRSPDYDALVEMFRQLDIDGDGNISFDEFVSD